MSQTVLDFSEPVGTSRDTRCPDAEYRRSLGAPPERVSAYSPVAEELGPKPETDFRGKGKRPKHESNLSRDADNLFIVHSQAIVSARQTIRHE